ncbi:isochorismate synthase DhbC [Actinomycetospora sp. NBRC 106375]|uniref:chorismate-binding protein n=1 Tax=Actinomycetospora sp. NBRC 106375 TaxID=3032207 RepID=UPI0024A365D9|nr:chorismate-binding protein [Actinomycetospora sp. NBRC 106375]GLZ47940.1 isochorismate synthase DhbC [Actinomycetospora sp. NBRC 106375]
MTTTPTGAPTDSTVGTDRTESSPECLASPPGPAPAPGVARSVLVLPSGELHATGVRTTVEPDPATGRAGAAAVVARLHAEGVADPLVTGVLGADDGRPGRLVVPVAWERRARRAPAPPPPARDARAAGWDVRPEPAPPRYAAAVHRALELIADGEVGSVVLARALALVAPRPVDPDELLSALVDPDDDASAVRVDLDDRGGSSLVGLGDELLVARHGDRVVSAPLAGTAWRSADPDEDVRRGRELAAQADLTTHAVAVARAAERLAPWCDHLDVPTAPALVPTARRWRLVSRVEGRLRVPRPTALELAEVLRPGAGTWGDPPEVARAVVDDLEQADRGHLGAAAGWCAADGDGEWVVTAPCAGIRGRHVRLSAGALVAAGCRPETELAGTGATFRTLLAALGIESTP